MTTPRAQKISLDITPYYHCTSRCVRRSFLCGEDKVSGKSYEHRRQWVETRILALARVFCIDICSYAVMSNHYHLVVYINRQKAEQLSKAEVIERWATEHQLPPLIQRYLNSYLTTAENRQCEALIETWRQRLYSLSWLMKELNFEIAKQANQEDGCTGHFWEGRFKSQALLDEKALLAAMTYVDLNPVRAKVAPTPETSEHTSVKRRLDSLAQNQPTPPGLCPFIGYEHQDKPEGIPFRLMDYIEWIDQVGRQICGKKHGHINNRQPDILNRLSINQTECLKLCNQLERRRCLWIGPPGQLKKVKRALNKRRIYGISF
jgi:REP element-mobilizing transposase RayT